MMHAHVIQDMETALEEIKGCIGVLDMIAVASESSEHAYSFQAIAIVSESLTKVGAFIEAYNTIEKTENDAR